MKELYIFIIVVNTAIKSAINIIELVLAPTQIIIKGPSATFGSEFITVKYGSIIFANILFFRHIFYSVKDVQSPILLGLFVKHNFSLVVG